MKKSHYFEIYILRVLKQISDTNTLALNAKQQLNSFICIFINKLCCDVRKLLQFSHKKICTTTEVSNILHIILKGQLLENCLKEGQKAVDTFQASSKTKVSRIQKAGIIFPPSLVDKFFKQENLMVSQVSHLSIYVAAVCEYIVFEILDIAVINCKKKRLTICDLQMAVENDRELSQMFNAVHASFLIHTTQAENLLLSKTSFTRLVRQYTNQAKLPKNTLFTLQTYIEKYIIDLLKHASFLVIHTNRIKLLPSDIQLTYAMLEKLPSYNPYITKKNDELLMI